jgi:multidrug efflux pump subunit AcrB
VATLKRAQRPANLLRVNGRRAVEITGNPPDGEGVEKTAARCREVAEAVRREIGLSDQYQVGGP